MNSKLKRLTDEAYSYINSIDNLEMKKEGYLDNMLNQMKPELTQLVDLVKEARSILGKVVYKDSTYKDMKHRTKPINTDLFIYDRDDRENTEIRFSIYKDKDILKENGCGIDGKYPFYNEDDATHILISIPPNSNDEIKYQIENKDWDIRLDYSEFKNQFKKLVDTYEQKLMVKIEDKIISLKKEHTETVKKFHNAESEYTKFRTDYKSPVLKPLPDNLKEYLVNTIKKMESSDKNDRVYIEGNWRIPILSAYQRLQCRFNFSNKNIDFDKLYEEGVITLKYSDTENHIMKGTGQYNLRIHEYQWEAITDELDPYNYINDMDKEQDIITDLYIKGYYITTGNQPSIFITNDVMEFIQKKYTLADMTLDLGAYYDLSPLKELLKDIDTPSRVYLDTADDYER